MAGRHAPTPEELTSLIGTLDPRRQTNALILLHMIAKESAEEMQRTTAQFEAAPVDMLKRDIPMPAALLLQRMPAPAVDRPVAATPFDAPPLLTIAEAGKEPRDLPTNLYSPLYEAIEAHDTVTDFLADARKRKATKAADLLSQARDLMAQAVDLTKQAAKAEYEATRKDKQADPALSAVLAASDELTDRYCALIEADKADAGELERTRKAMQLTQRALDALKGESAASAPPAPVVIPPTLPEVLISMSARLRALDVCTPEQIDELTALQVLADRAHELAERPPARKPRSTKKPTKAQVTAKTA